MTDPTPIEKAEAAVCEAIAERANTRQTTPPPPSADDLKKLAEGVAAIKHGAQGGAYSYVGDYTSRADNHNTAHDGEARDRPGPTGFGGDDG